MSIGKIILQREQREFQCTYCIVSGDLPTLMPHQQLLHPSEQEYLHSLRYDSRKTSWLLGRYAAKKAIHALCAGQDMRSFWIDYGVFHFPVVKNSINPNIQVSITHSGDIGIALAFPEEHPVAIDMEKVDPAKLDAVSQLVSDREASILHPLFPSRVLGYTLLWTVKEGLSKILKTGLTMNFQILEIDSLRAAPFGYITSFRNFPQFKGYSFHAGQYACSIVMPAKSTPCLQQFIGAFLDIIPA